MEPKPKQFRFSAQIGLWTYSTGETEPNLSSPIIAHALESLGAPIVYYCIGREVCPKTGNIHFHVFVEFLVRPNFKKREQLLVNGYGINC